MNCKHLNIPLTGFKISIALLFTVIFSAITIVSTEAQAQTGADTLEVKPVHILNPSRYADTLYLKGYSVQHLVDSSGTAVFLYDPNTGKWDIDSTLSTGLLEQN